VFFGLINKQNKAAIEYYNSLNKRHRSPEYRDVLIFHAQKTSFGELKIFTSGIINIGKIRAG
jgi:hypothetical protein